MIVTVLAAAFLILIGFIAFLGYNIVIKKGPDEKDANMEKCTICRNKFRKEELILRQIGDFKLLFFCRDCILKLHADLKN